MKDCAARPSPLTDWLLSFKVSTTTGSPHAILGLKEADPEGLLLGDSELEGDRLDDSDVLGLRLGEFDDDGLSEGLAELEGESEGLFEEEAEPAESVRVRVPEDVNFTHVKLPFVPVASPPV